MEAQNSLPIYYESYSHKQDKNYRLLIKNCNFKCWFCEEKVTTIIGICEICKNYRLPNIK